MLKHLGIIPDGNRRYSVKEDISLIEAYKQGFDKGEEVFDWVLEIPTIQRATIYGLSTENIFRKEEELEILAGYYNFYFRKLSEDRKIHNNEVKVRVIGRHDQFNGVSEAVDILQKATQEYNKYTLNIALEYGGRAEIFDAVKRIYEQKIDINTINEDNFSKFLYEPNDIDLLIRTGGKQRISNFLPWQTAYSELYFTDVLWPDFDRKEFDKALSFYDDTKRNFGK